jgi:hypothetical protein
LINEPSEAHKEAEIARGREIAKVFQNMSFAELLSRQPSVDDLHMKLADIFKRISVSGPSNGQQMQQFGSSNSNNKRRSFTNEASEDSSYETSSLLHADMQFPELFVY